MPLSLYLVDAFADRPFSGNPAAVVLLDSNRDDDWMQSVASEMNLSETAFVQQKEESRFDLRWFTPAYEVDLCGHATVASAHVLWESGIVSDRANICFDSRSGELQVRADGEQVELDFPLTPPEVTELPSGLAECFSVDGFPAQINYCGRSRFDFLLEVPSESAVRNLDVDFGQLVKTECRGVIVTAVADNDAKYDFVSRFFAPAAGVNEDPVTGSAHCCLADFWARKLSQTQMTGYQASRRGGFVGVTVKGDRVLLSGGAVTVSRGELNV